MTLNAHTTAPDFTSHCFYTGLFTTGNFKVQFEQLVSDMLAFEEDGKAPTIARRNAGIIALTDAYFEQTGETPDGVQLQRLANWLLLEYLTDPHPDKVTRTEYPIMNKRQLRTRYGREKANEFIEAGASNVNALPLKSQKQIHRKKFQDDAY